MSALAQLIKHRGETVKGSDRGFDQGQNSLLSGKLQSQGIQLFPQDGSGIEVGDRLIVSTAVEATIPDVAAARAKNVPVMHRSELLAELFNSSKGVAVGGTSGKSSVTAMTGHILHVAGISPTVINGAVMPQFSSNVMHGNVLCGDGDVMVIEADESDGSIVNYRPYVGIVNNVSKDHKSLEELNELFSIFASNCKKLVVNGDCPETAKVEIPAGVEVVSCGIENDAVDFHAEKLKRTAQGVEFQLNSLTVRLPVIGRHNVENALAAIAAASLLGVAVEDSAKALATYPGIERRMQLVGEVNGITVIDDFAHNPDKVRAVLQAVKEGGARTVVFFQPHGFGPTRFLKNEFIESFSVNSDSGDLIIMPEIYYAGGSVERTISAKDLIDGIRSRGRNALFVPDRNDIPALIKEKAGAGDCVLLLGARDVTLAAFAAQVLEELKK